MYYLLLIVIYLAFISLGLPDSLLGAAWPSIYIDLNVPQSFMGIISMIISFGTVISSLLSERLSRKLGTKYIVLISVVLTALALFGFSFSSHFWMLCLFAIPYGFGAGAIDATLNNFVAKYYSSRHMSWLHSFWGVGTIISPYIMSFALDTSSFALGYRIVAFIQLGISVVLLLSIPIWNKATIDLDRREESKENEENKNEKIGILKTLRLRGVILLLIGFFAYTSLESVSQLWAASFYVNYRGFNEVYAASFSSMFFIGMTVGRFIAGFISEKLGDRNMIRLGVGIAFIGIILLFIPYGTYTSVVGFAILGLGCGPIYPSIIHSTPQRFGFRVSLSLIGIEMATAYIGSTFMPPLFGIIATSTSFIAMPIWLLTFLVICILLLEISFSKTNKENNESINKEISTK